MKMCSTQPIAIDRIIFIDLFYWFIDRKPSRFSVFSTFGKISIGCRPP